MKNIFLITLISVFTFIILIFFSLLFYKSEPSKLPSALINKKVPSFKTLSLLDNQEFLSDIEFNNNLTLVNFFATWCIPCKAEHKYLERFAINDDLKIIGINYKDNPKKALDWLTKLGNPYSKIATDQEGNIAIDWGVYGIPETFIVNNKNVIKYRLVGPITDKNINKFYNEIKKYDIK